MKTRIAVVAAALMATSTFAFGGAFSGGPPGSPYAAVPSLPLRSAPGSATGVPSFVGLPCSWSGVGAYGRGVAAYQGRHYHRAIAQWEAAAAKTCAGAAYNVGMLYFGGKGDVSADRALGTAWLLVASDTSPNTPEYQARYRTLARMAIGTLDPAQRIQLDADYATARATLDLPARALPADFAR